jgi:hypothetical protein
MTGFPHDDDMPNLDHDAGDDAELELPADPRFDAWIARQAPALNAPNATPRDDMWQAIQAAQRTHVAAADGTVAGVLPLRRRWPLPAAIAAALLLGIVIDRVATRAVEPGVVPPPPRVATIAPRAPRTDSVPLARHDAPEPRAVGTTVAAAPRAPHTTPSASRRSGAADSALVSRLYRLAAVQTLTQAEALLTSYRATDLATRDPAAARQLGGWGREVLSSTRLLIDSPAGADPQLRPLLNDLELVLVQIVRLSGAPLDASDRALIDGALRDRDLLPRIRTVVPAGAAATTSDEE